MTKRGADEITISWNIEDVQEALELRGGDLGSNIVEKLTLAEKRKVLRLCLENHDAHEGINWGVLDRWIWEVLYGKEQMKRRQHNATNNTVGLAGSGMIGDPMLDHIDVD